MNYLKLTKDKLNINEINELVAHESCGAVSLFVGTTRDNFEDKKVISLEYEAYEPMAIKSMTKICNEIRENWNDVQNIGIYHRLGEVPVKEASVVIAISSPHRKSSLEAVSFAIEELKKEVPVWKKEKYEIPAGSSEWKENKESNDTKSILKLMKRKRVKMNFEDCAVSNLMIPKSLIQINADEEEVARRVNTFVARKREEIDINNVQDFIEAKSSNDEYSCARVHSSMFRTKNSKGHLKVHRVENEYGPQTTINYTNALDKLMGSSEYKVSNEIIGGGKNINASGVEERLLNAENYLGILSPLSKNVYERLKSIENRILYLETISPEYSHFIDSQRLPNQMKFTKKVYSITDLDTYIDELKMQIKE